MKRTATLTSKGQVTIPKPVRQALGLQTGDTLVFEPGRAGDYIIRPARRTLTSAGVGRRLLPRGFRAPSVAEIDQGIADSVSGKWRRS